MPRPKTIKNTNATNWVKLWEDTRRQKVNRDYPEKGILRTTKYNAQLTGYSSTLVRALGFTGNSENQTRIRKGVQQLIESHIRRNDNSRSSTLFSDPELRAKNIMSPNDSATARANVRNMHAFETNAIMHHPRGEGATQKSLMSRLQEDNTVEGKQRRSRLKSFLTSGTFPMHEGAGSHTRKNIPDHIRKILKNRTLLQHYDVNPDDSKAVETFVDKHMKRMQEAVFDQDPDSGDNPTMDGKQKHNAGTLKDWGTVPSPARDEHDVRPSMRQQGLPSNQPGRDYKEKEPEHYYGRELDQKVEKVREESPERMSAAVQRTPAPQPRRLAFTPGNTPGSGMKPDSEQAAAQPQAQSHLTAPPREQSAQGPPPVNNVYGPDPLVALNQSVTNEMFNEDLKQGAHGAEVKAVRNQISTQYFNNLDVIQQHLINKHGEDKFNEAINDIAPQVLTHAWDISITGKISDSARQLFGDTIPDGLMAYTEAGHVDDNGGKKAIYRHALNNTRVSGLPNYNAISAHTEPSFKDQSFESLPSYNAALRMLDAGVSALGANLGDSLNAAANRSQLMADTVNKGSSNESRGYFYATPSVSINDGLRALSQTKGLDVSGLGGQQGYLDPRYTTPQQTATREDQMTQLANHMKNLHKRYAGGEIKEAKQGFEAVVDRFGPNVAAWMRQAAGDELRRENPGVAGMPMGFGFKGGAEMEKQHLAIAQQAVARNYQDDPRRVNYPNSQQQEASSAVGQAAQGEHAAAHTVPLAVPAASSGLRGMVQNDRQQQQIHSEQRRQRLNGGPQRGAMGMQQQQPGMLQNMSMSEGKSLAAGTAFNTALAPLATDFSSGISNMVDSIGKRGKMNWNTAVNQGLLKNAGHTDYKFMGKNGGLAQMTKGGASAAATGAIMGGMVGGPVGAGMGALGGFVGGEAAEGVKFLTNVFTRAGRKKDKRDPKPPKKPKPDDFLRVQEIKKAAAIGDKQFRPLYTDPLMEARKLDWMRLPQFEKMEREAEAMFIYIPSGSGEGTMKAEHGFNSIHNGNMRNENLRFSDNYIRGPPFHIPATTNMVLPLELQPGEQHLDPRMNALRLLQKTKPQCDYGFQGEKGRIFGPAGIPRRRDRGTKRPLAGSSSFPLAPSAPGTMDPYAYPAMQMSRYEPVAQPLTDIANMGRGDRNLLDDTFRETFPSACYDSGLVDYAFEQSRDHQSALHNLRGRSYKKQKRY